MTNELINLRRTLHKYPEVSNNETETSLRISAFMSALNPTKILEGVGGRSVVVIFGDDPSAKSVLVRCELDALPIQEINDFDYKSAYEGVSHKCGHDGHMAIVAGLGVRLKKEPISGLNVILLFQQAEETGSGARDVLADDQFASLTPDYAIALHNIPGYPLKQIVLKPQAFTPSVTSIIIHLDGKTSHAAEPEHGINPALAVSEIVKRAAELEINEDSDKMQLLTPVQIDLGEEAYGVSAGHAVVRYTLRAWKEETLQNLKTDFANDVLKIALEANLSVKIEWTQTFASNYNNSELIEVLATSAHQLRLDVYNKEYPFKWGEDFGLFTQKFKGALFGLGAGEDTPALHNPDYDFPDELIETGVQMFYQTLKNLGNK